MPDDPDDITLLSTLERLASYWRGHFAAEMGRRGYPWHSTAAGDLLGHLAAEPVSQSELTQRSGLSKQAVQQLLDQLESLGVIIREPDPADRRAKRIRLTPLGQADLTDRRAVLADIDAAARELIGKKTAKRLRKALRAL